MQRLVMHIDLDAFFAAVEQRDHPHCRGLPLVVGVEPERRGVVAKLASDYQKPDGLTVVTPDRVRHFLDPMPLAVLHDVGVKTAQRLEQMDVTTVGDVSRLLTF